MKNHKIPPSKQMTLFSRLRTAIYYSDHEKRTKCIKARLQAISTLCYAFPYDERVIYHGLLDELVDVAQLPDGEVMSIKACALRTMTAIFNLQRANMKCVFHLRYSVNTKPKLANNSSSNSLAVLIAFLSLLGWPTFTGPFRHAFDAGFRVWWMALATRLEAALINSTPSPCFHFSTTSPPLSRIPHQVRFNCFDPCSFELKIGFPKNLTYHCFTLVTRACQHRVNKSS